MIIIQTGNDNHAWQRVAGSRGGRVGDQDGEVARASGEPCVARELAAACTITARAPSAVPQTFASSCTPIDERQAVPSSDAGIQFFPDHSAECLLERLGTAFQPVAQRSVHQGLEVAAAGSLDLTPEPLEDIVVQANRNPSLFSREWIDRSPPRMREMVFVFHCSSRAYA
jgi:hypothetical protein